MWTLPLDQARAQSIAFAELGAGPKEEMAAVDDRTVPGPAGAVPVRVYTPVEAGAALPGVVYFHGGGWVIMGIETHDWICRRLAKESGAVVVSVEYRLAPEHRFPAALDDCYAAAKYVAAHASEFGVDGARVAVAGDSAGGNLSAAVALQARAAGEPALAAQVLVYPVTDAAGDTESYQQNTTGYLLEEPAMKWFWEQYMGPDGDPYDAYASVLRAADLSGLPPAIVITAEYDPLRDEGEAYGARLREAGVPVATRRYTGHIHSSTYATRLMPSARRYLDDVRRALVAAHKP
jgi:acetyl esterase